MELLDPLKMSDSDWPAGSYALRVYAQELCRKGSQQLVANVRTRVMILRDGGVVVPVTINDTEYANSHVCSPYTAMRYMKEERHQADNAALEALTGFYADAGGLAMKWARFNKVIHVNNWLFDMNSYPVDWVPDVQELISVVTESFPEHFICFNSLNRWSNDALMTALARGGFELSAYRQIYVFEDLKKNVLRRSHTKRDFSILRKTPYEVHQEDALQQEDFARLAELYYLAYCKKHSLFNPIFTAHFMRTAHEAGLIRFVCLRTADGRIDAFQTFFTAEHVQPICPFSGWDPAIDHEYGLFRMTTAIMFDTAAREGWNVNFADTNAQFKRNRGAKPVMDYKANYARHLSAGRRLTLALFTQISNRIYGPAMEKLEV